MRDTEDLKELVQKAATGDRTAFEELYRETCRSVYFTCLGILKDEQEAQDVTQDVYLTVFEQLSTLEDTDKFKPWLYRIAANKSIKRLKKKQPMLPGDEQLENMETEENENFLPEEYALNAEKRELVLKIVQKTCSDVLYQTILLHYFNEFSIAEIAEIMKCPEGTVKYRLNVARAKIKEGVMQYEKKSGDKLYSVAVVPFLTAWFTAQMQDMQMPSISLDFLSALPQSTLAAAAAKTGGSMILKGLQLKIATGIATAVVVVGGVTAAAVIIHNQSAQEVSTEGQENSLPDAADAGNAGDIETVPEIVAGETEPEGENLQAENGTGNGTDTATEVTTGESEMPEETEPAEATPEPDAEEETQYTYTDMDAIMYAKQTVNVRNQPSTGGAKVGSLSVNDEVAVTGQCNETGWYRFEYNGEVAYVSNNYVSDTKIEVAAAEPAQSASSSESSGGSTNNAGKEPCPYPLNKIMTETTSYGLTIWVLYTTMPGETIWVPLYSGLSIENSSVMTDHDEVGQSAFGYAVNREVLNLEDSTGTFHGFHYVYPAGVKVGTYAEGTVYRFTAGIHTYDTYNSELGRVRCPNNETGCQPGTIN